MNTNFDPYHKWLGIPPSEQPPNYYRLLGITLFETDVDVISHAADQRMVHVKTFQTGPHGAASQKILGEIAAARVCLLTPGKKAAYDQHLREKLKVDVAGPVLATVVDDAERAGTVTGREVQRAEQEFLYRKGVVHETEHRWHHHRQRLFSANALLKYVHLLRRIRTLTADLPAEHAGGTVIAAGACTTLGIIVAAIFLTSAKLVFLCGFLAMVLGTALAIHALYVPSAAGLDQWEESQRQTIAEVQNLLPPLEAEVHRARELSERAESDYRRLQAVLQNKRNQLLAADWRSLRGAVLELFLKDVFETQGCDVQMPGGTPPPTINLLVTYSEAKIAVRALGGAEPVGEVAVNEAQSGKAQYDCSRCAVVANSSFTPAARELAQRVGCQLVDADRMPDLIRGEMRL